MVKEILKYFDDRDMSISAVYIESCLLYEKAEVKLPNIVTLSIHQTTSIKGDYGLLFMFDSPVNLFPVSTYRYMIISDDKILRFLSLIIFI